MVFMGFMFHDGSIISRCLGMRCLTGFVFPLVAAVYVAGDLVAGIHAATLAPIPCEVQLARLTVELAHAAEAYQGNICGMTSRAA